MGNALSRGAVAFRVGLGAALLVSVAVPLLLLLVWSAGRAWFFPALVPSDFSGDAWALLGGSLGRAAATSTGIALVVGALSGALGFVVGRAIAQLRGWPRHVAAALAFLPIAAPSIALGTGAQYYFLRLGLGGSPLGVILAHTAPAAGLASLYFLGVFSVTDRRLEDEARTLGARPWQVLLRVTIPAFRRQIAEAIALGFLVSWSQVPLTLLVGGGLVRTLPLAVFSYIRAGQERYAAVGALLLIVPPMLVLGMAMVGTRRAAVIAA